MPLQRFVEVEWKPNAMLRLRKSSMRIYGFNLDQHILPALGEVPIRDISRAQIEGCLSGLQRKGYAVATLRSVRATFSTVLGAAIAHRYIEERTRLIESAFAKRIRDASRGTTVPRRFVSCFNSS